MAVDPVKGALVCAWRRAREKGQARTEAAELRLVGAVEAPTTVLAAAGCAASAGDGALPLLLRRLPPHRARRPCGVDSEPGGRRVRDEGARQRAERAAGVHDDRHETRPRSSSLVQVLSSGAVSGSS